MMTDLAAVEAKAEAEEEDDVVEEMRDDGNIEQ